ncbi:MAG: hypothetical protein BEN18_01425 [Epulopiscium sp. Nuni2H_MBin001]|nr:MAG: hypothetical protein BEN18_01425 [Epulopiscium sp. Nuni2H_MBin001]
MTILAQFLMLLFIVGIINSIIGIFKIRKVLKEHGDDPNIEGIAIINGEVQVIEKDKKMQSEVVIAQVKSDCCGKMIAKNDAYRFIIDGTEHYFCSWDCKEEYLVNK